MPATGARTFLEFKILNYATGKPDKVQVRDLVRIVGNVEPIAQRGLGGGAVRGKIRFIEPQGVNGHRRPVTCAMCPKQRYATGEPGKAGTGQCGDCIRVLWVPDPWGQYSGKIRFIEKPGVQDEGGRHVAKCSSDPPGSITRSQSSGKEPGASCGYLPSLTHGGGGGGFGTRVGVGTQGKIVLSSPRGHGRPVPCAPSSGMPRESQAKRMDGTVWGL